MKKLILLTVILSVIVVSGCGSTQVSQSNIVWKSQPKGDFAIDDRNPADVCKQIQTEQNLNNCTLVTSMSANTDSECVDGKSVAGCFACKFSCP
jgi:hypothetical protein